MSEKLRLKTRDYVLGYLDGLKDVKTSKLFFTDINGRIKSITVNISQLERVMKEGASIDGSSIEGWARIYESDLKIKADPETMMISPWKFEDKNNGKNYRECVFICDVLEPSGKSYGGDPRYVLKKAEKRLEKKTFTANFSPETEYFIFENDKEPVTGDRGGYFDTGLDPYELGNLIIHNLEVCGIDADGHHSEVSNGQFETITSYASPVTAADNKIKEMYVTRKTAKKQGKHISFMPKPINGVNGSGMHIHQSLYKDGINAFYDSDDKYNLSDVAKQFMAGQLETVKECTLVYNPTINSYKRLVPGFEAPTYITWGTRNRSTLQRIPTAGKNSKRCELRSPDSSGNPYLQFATMIMAGLKGIKKNLELMPPFEGNVYENKDKFERLPENLEEAINLAQEGIIIKKTFGEPLFEKYIDSKLRELNRYNENVKGKYKTGAKGHSTVTPWEIEVYYPIV